MGIQAGLPNRRQTACLKAVLDATVMWLREAFNRPVELLTTRGTSCAYIMACDSSIASVCCLGFSLACSDERDVIRLFETSLRQVFIRDAGLKNAESESRVAKR